MFDFHVLDENDEPKRVETMEEWAAFMRDTERRRVALDEFGRVTVSTVFIGLNPPLLFETAVFVDMSDRDKGLGAADECVGYPTWEAALEGHRQIVERWRLEWDV